MIVYRITNLVTGRLYIGASTLTSVEQRWAAHVSKALRGGGGDFYRDIRELGPLEFGMTVLAKVRTKKALRETERAMILAYGANKDRLYNTTLGGEGIPLRRTRRTNRQPANPAQDTAAAAVSA